MTPDQYCEEKAASSGSSFYYSFLFLPKEQRRAITAVYAFCREVDDIVDECRDVGMARTRLEWWRTEVARLFDGAPQHPVTRALAPAVERYGLSQEYFQELIDGMEMDLDQTRYADFSELSLYCYRVASTVGLLAIEIFGYEDRMTVKYAHDLGIAFQLTNILRDVGEDAARGRIYLPQDELTRHGVDEAELKSGVMNDRIRALLQEQAARARTWYAQAFRKLPETDRYQQRSGLIMAAVYMTLLDAIENEGYPVLSRRVRLSRWRKLWLAWRTARREYRRHVRHGKHHG